MALNRVQSDGKIFTVPSQISVCSTGQPSPVTQRVRVRVHATFNDSTINASSEPDRARLAPNL